MPAIYADRIPLFFLPADAVQSIVCESSRSCDRCGRGPVRRAREHRSQNFPDIFHDLCLRLGIRMYSVRLKKLTLVAKAIQKKRYQPHSMAFRQLREYILKLL